MPGWSRKGLGSELCLGTSGLNSSVGTKGTVGLWWAPASVRVLWQRALVPGPASAPALWAESRRVEEHHGLGAVVTNGQAPGYKGSGTRGHGEEEKKSMEVRDAAEKPVGNRLGG